MKRVLLSLVLISSISLHAKQQYTTFMRMIDARSLCQLDDFIEFMDISEQDKEAFIVHYKQLIDKLERPKSLTRKKNEVERLQKMAINALEVKNAALKAALDNIHYGNVPVKHSPKLVNRNINMFLTRYGALEEYYQVKSRVVSSSWQKVKGFAKNVRYKVSNWFKSLRKSKESSITT